MKKVCTILLLCILAHPLWAQEQPSLAKRAATYYVLYDYARAANIYREMASKKKVQLLTLERLADCYRQINNYSDAAVWYGKLVTMPDALPEDGLHYGDMLKCLGRYNEAKAAYQQYAQKTGQTQRVANRIAGCDSAQVWMQYPTNTAITNIKQLNTTKSDWGATYYPHSIVFMSDSLYRNQLSADSRVNKKLYGRSRNAYYKLYKADSLNYGNFFISDLSPAFNQYLYHIGPVVFNNTYDTAYFTVTNPQPAIEGEKQRIEKVLVNDTRRLELFITSKDGQGNWRAPVAFAYNSPATYSLGQAALSPDGSVMYFTSNMPGGQGGTDIWYSERQTNGSWGTPQNCGTLINTPEDEAFPTVGPDGSLFFSSKGHVGMGGYDIFIASGNRAQWITPLNLKSPLNAAGDDFYLINGPNATGYFASNRSGGVGNDDIYGFANASQYITPTFIPLLQIPFEGIICPRFRNACIYLYNKQRDIGWCFSPDPNGKIYITLEHDTDYELRITNTNGSRYVISFDSRGRTDNSLFIKEFCPQVFDDKKFEEMQEDKSFKKHEMKHHKKHKKGRSR